MKGQTTSVETDENAEQKIRQWSLYDLNLWID
jgi:hypothetical protein